MEEREEHKGPQSLNKTSAAHTGREPQSAPQPNSWSPDTDPANLASRSPSGE